MTTQVEKITPFLWFDGRAEEAVKFYVSLFEDSRIENLQRLRGGPGDGNVIATFRLAGRQFMALDGGPHFTLTPAVSFLVSCETQAEIDRLWDALLAGGEAQQCGWLTDRFGLTWQIVPRVLGELMSDPDAEKAGRVMNAMLEMVKLDIGALQRAYDGADGQQS